jgi:preprotein translocase subunit YajC
MQHRVYIRRFEGYTQGIVNYISYMAGSTMKTRVMHTVHTMLQKSGQSVPAKHLSVSENSLEVYDVEHWPESFNSLLLHDFPYLVISIDSSTASVSGFVVTLRWNQSPDISEWVSKTVHIIVMCVLLTTMVYFCYIRLQQVSVDELDRICSLYAGHNVHESGVYGNSSSLADELRSVIAHSEPR